MTRKRQMNEGHPVRFGVVGAGAWSAIAHLPAIHANADAELVAVADLDAERLARTSAEFGVVDCYDDYRRLIAQADIDALVVATSHTSHYAIARAGLEAGLHLLVEKPLTVRAQEAWMLADFADSSGLHLVVGYTSQFGAGARAAREFIQAGGVGEISMLSVLFTSNLEDLIRGVPSAEHPMTVLSPTGGPELRTYSDPAKSGGGQGQSQVTHALGMQYWVTGLEPARVSAFMADRGAAVDLVDVINVQLTNGALGSVAASGALGVNQAPQQELAYYGDKGALVQDFISGCSVFHPRDGGPSTVIADPMSTEEEELLRFQPVNALVDLIRGGTSNPGAPGPAIAAVQTLEAAYRSAAAQGVPQEVALLGLPA